MRAQSPASILSASLDGTPLSEIRSSRRASVESCGRSARSRHAQKAIIDRPTQKSRSSSSSPPPKPLDVDPALESATHPARPYRRRPPRGLRLRIRCIESAGRVGSERPSGSAASRPCPRRRMQLAESHHGPVRQRSWPAAPIRPSAAGRNGRPAAGTRSPGLSP